MFDGIPAWCFVAALIAVGVVLWCVWPVRGHISETDETPDKWDE